MKLCVMRHGPAGPSKEDPKKERERPLTAEGRRVVTDIARTMLQLDEIPKMIFTSELPRAQQTADIVGKILGVEVDVIDDLGPRFPVQEVLGHLLDYDHVKRVMLVGHMDNIDPCFQDLAVPGQKWPDIVKAEVRRVEIDRKTGEWKLKWRLRPSDLGYDDEKD